MWFSPLIVNCSPTFHSSRPTWRLLVPLLRNHRLEFWLFQIVFGATYYCHTPYWGFYYNFCSSKINVLKIILFILKLTYRGFDQFKGSFPKEDSRVWYNLHLMLKFNWPSIVKGIIYLEIVHLQRGGSW